MIRIKNKSTLSYIWVLLGAAVCIAGMVLRFYHLDWKTYAFDETVTSIRVSGFLISDFLKFVDDRQIHYLHELLQFQTVSPERDAASTVKSLIREDPQHPPLYFLILREASIFGANTVWLRRFPSALFADFLIPAMWLLSYQLFRSKATSWIVAALVAVSPFHLAYAQQAREYSLWSLSIVLSSSLLLRALWSSSRLNWVYYFFATAISLWCYTLSLYVVLSHLFFVVFMPKTNRSVKVAFALSAGAAVLTFTPWLYIILNNVGRIHTATGWDNAALPLKVFSEKWLFNLTTTFFDLDYLSLQFLPIAFAIVVIIAVCLTITIRRCERFPLAFLLFFGGINFFALLIPDLILHQSHSTQARYLTPTWLSVELVVAYALGCLGWGPAGRRYRGSGLGRGITIFLVICGAISCAVSSQARYWWIASDSRAIPAIAQSFQRGPGGQLIVYASDDFYFLELANAVDKSLRFCECFPIAANDAIRKSTVYLIGRPAQIASVTTSLSDEALKTVTLPKIFPIQDPSISGLRAEGKHARRDPQFLEDLSLWSLSPQLTNQAGR